ncbi:hypothetical protein Tco_0811629 [Tanacetum coccineum]
MNDLRNVEQLAQDLARENNNESSSGEEEEGEQQSGGDDDYSDEDEWVDRWFCVTVVTEAELGVDTRNLLIANSGNDLPVVPTITNTEWAESSTRERSS